jgi:hypothetical protein
MCPSSTSSSERDVGLVSAQEELTRSGWRRLGAPLVSAFFVASLAGVGLLDTIAPAPYVTVAGPDQALRMQEEARASLWDGSRMRIIDRERQEASRVRHALVPWYVVGVLFPLDEGSSEIVVGRQGWLFMADRIVPDATGHRDDTPALAANLLSAYDRRLSALGIETVFMPVPRKGAVAPQYLPAGADVRPEIETSIVGALAERRVPHVDCLAAWSGLNTEILWQRWDTHWTGLARWYAFEAASRELGDWVAPKRRPDGFNLHRRRADNSMLLVSLGIPPEHPVRRWLEPDLLPSPVAPYQDAQALDAGAAEITIVGTSFSRGAVATDLLAHATNRSVQNLGEAGESAQLTLLRRLSDGSISDGARLLLEWPVYQMLPIQTSVTGMDRLDPRLARLLTQAQPPVWNVLPVDMPRQGRRSWRLPRQRLATSGDGSVHLELTEFAGRTHALSVSVRAAGYELVTPWPPGLERLHVPLIAPWANSLDVRVIVNNLPMEDSVAVRVVSELDLPAARELAETSIERGDDGWTQDRALTDGLFASRHAAVWVELDSEGPAGELTLQLVSARGDVVHEVGRVVLKAGGTALLRASAPRGRWATLRLLGEGEAPTRVGSVRIADLAR